MPTPPETTNYLYLALAATFILAGGYVASIWFRLQNLNKDEKLIEQLLDES